MEISTGLSNELSRYLDLNTRLIQLTATNMANIDTPGYRATGMDFEAEMRGAIAEIESGAGLEEEGMQEPAWGGLGSGHRRGFSQPAIRPVDGLIVRPDGNNVSMDRESLNLAAAQLRFKLGVALLKGEFATVMNAIHADAK